MGRRGRPRRAVPPVVVNVKLLLTPGEDDDLIAFFRSLPPRRRAQAVIAALRGTSLTSLRPADVPDDDEVADALADLVF